MSGHGPRVCELVRQTATHVLETGAPVLPLARPAQEYLDGATPLSADQPARLHTQLTVARAAHHRIARQSRRLTQGKAWSPGTIVNAYDPTLAPMCQGKRHCPAPCGRKPGMIAEPAAGFILARHLPVGHPRASRDGQPLVDKGAQAITRVSPRPAIHARAGDVACPDASLREALHQRGMRTVGIPNTVDPVPPAPTPEAVLRLLGAERCPRARTPCQVHLA